MLYVLPICSNGIKICSYTSSELCPDSRELSYHLPFRTYIDNTTMKCCFLLFHRKIRIFSMITIKNGFNEGTYPLKYTNQCSFDLYFSFILLNEYIFCSNTIYLCFLGLFGAIYFLSFSSLPYCLKRDFGSLMEL